MTAEQGTQTAIVAAHIRAERRRLNFTQAELADKAGMTVEQIVNIETGRKTRLSIDDVITIASALGVPLSALWPEAFPPIERIDELFTELRTLLMSMGSDDAIRNEQARPARIPLAEVAEIAATNPTRYAPILMERYGIPRTTANRWVREARLRGYLTSDLDRPCRTCGGTGVMRYSNGAAPREEAAR